LVGHGWARCCCDLRCSKLLDRPMLARSSIWALGFAYVGCYFI
jgi:hypothetical protein